MADWDKLKNRGRVSDRRSQSGGSLFGGGSIFGRSSGSGVPQLPINLNGMSPKTLIVVIIIMVIFSIISDGSGGLSDIINPQLDNSQVTSDNQIDSSEFAGEDNYEVFVSTVLGSNNAMWEGIFDRNNLDYQEPQLVLFRDFTSSSCGGATSQSGPHYCPANQTIYIDERFFDDVLSKFGSEGGDVAEAYIIGHEVGHHAQNLLGLTEQINRARAIGASNVNELSVELELQADCFSGLWANSIKDLGVFGPDEIREALSAASAVGDDRIQQKTEGRINPESWTHGSSEQREQWFNTGYLSGDFTECGI